MKAIVSLFILATLLTSCVDSPNPPRASNQIEYSKASPENYGSVAPKLIKTANLRFETEDNEKTYTLINNSLKDFGAFISRENTYNYDDEKGYELTIKVPEKQFDSLINYIIENGLVEELSHKTTEIQDVTEEFIDVEARLKIKKEGEQKLYELLEQASNLSETVAIQEQLNNLRSEIESIEGRLNYLSKQVNYSTIDVTFYEKIKYSKRFFKEFSQALQEGWQVFLYLLASLTYLWVVILVYLAIKWIIKYVKKNKAKK